MSYITRRVKRLYYTIMINVYVWTYSLAVDALLELTSDLEALDE